MKLSEVTRFLETTSQKPGFRGGQSFGRIEIMVQGMIAPPYIIDFVTRFPETTSQFQSKICHPNVIDLAGQICLARSSKL